MTEQQPQWSEVDVGGLTIGLNAGEGTSAHSDGGAVITFPPDGGIEDEVQRVQDAGGAVQQVEGRVTAGGYCARGGRRRWREERRA